MRLLYRDAHSQNGLKLSDNNQTPPPYAILSHTWGQDQDEVTFNDIQNQTGHNKAGRAKIDFCLDRAARDGLQYCWVDTCCINKAEVNEFQQAINLMFQWYQNAAKCYVYLADVPGKSFVDSRWFTRGWTLQELLAPSVVEFFSSDGVPMGDRRSRAEEIHRKTGLPIAVLRSGARDDVLQQYTWKERISWIKQRQTKFPEDKVYSLFGIFDVVLPLLYGEGEERAKRRLYEEIWKNSDRSEYDEEPNGFETIIQPDRMRYRLTEDRLVGSIRKDHSLVSLFNTCAQLLNNVDTHGDASGEFDQLASDFESDKIRFHDWADRVGVADGRLSGPSDGPQSGGMDVTEHVKSILHKMCESLSDDKWMESAVQTDPADKRWDASNPGGSTAGIEQNARKDQKSNTEFTGPSRSQSQDLQQQGLSVVRMKLLQKSIQQLLMLTPTSDEDSYRPISSRYKGLNRVRKVWTSSAGTSLERDLQMLHEEDLEVTRRQALTAIEQWLDGPATDREFEDHLESCLPGTCEWIFKDIAFTSWLQQENHSDTKSKLLWIYGGPGHGKSVLCSKIVRYIKLHLPHLQPVAYFFSSALKQSGGKPRDIARSWVSQLARADLDALRIVGSFMRARQADKRAIQSDVWEILGVILQGKPGQTLILDGIDELERSNNERASFLATVKSKAIATGTRFLVVSRDERDIRQELTLVANHDELGEHTQHDQHNWVILNCGLNTSNLGADIALFSQHIVDRKLTGKDSGIRHEIAGMMASKSDCMFQWIKMQERYLDSYKPLKKLRSIVNSMPSGLDNTYIRNWQSIQKNSDNNERALAIIMLRRVLYTARPLTVMELVDSLLTPAPSGDGHEDSSTDNGLLDGSLKEGDLPEAIDDEYVGHAIVERCEFLVRIQDVAAPNLLSSRTVGLIHFTVEEFLSKALPKPEGFDRPDLIKMYENTVLAQLCVQYLDHSSAWTSTTIAGETYTHRPFVKYASSYWFQHFRPDDPSLTKACREFLHSDNVNFKRWRDYYESVYVAVDEDEALVSHKPSTPIYYIALFGLVNLLACVPIELLKQDLNRSHGRFGSPLAAACLRKHRTTVDKLIEYGANVSAQGGLFGNALNAAILAGDEAIVTTLIRLGSDLYVPDYLGQSSLHLAALEGMTDTLELLLWKDERIDATDKDGFTAVNAASYKGRIEAVQLLLDKGANLEKATDKGVTPLFSACFNGHLEVVRLLLDKGANLEKASDEGVTPLYTASNNNYLEVAQLLLNRGADIMKEARGGWTSINTASKKGHVEMVRLLLDKGANLEKANSKGMTPLYSACNNGHLKVVSLLLDKGAESKVTTTTGRTPLYAACERGHLETVRLLLNKGANPLLTTDLNVTPLNSACSKGHIEIIRLLLNQGADVTASSKNGWTPLHTASNNGHLEAVRLLLVKGADPTAVSISNATPLYHACFRAHIEVVRLLLDKGADPNIPMSHGKWTPVNKASNQGHLEIVRLLVDKGADLTIANTRGETPLYSAYFQGHVDTMRLLLDKGADPNITIDGWTPVNRASSMGELEVVRLLLDKGADLTIANTRGATPLYSACFQGHVDTMRLLLDKGADPNITIDGWTPISRASYKGNLEVVRLLLDKGADIRNPMVTGLVPLVFASKKGHLEVVKLLLDHGVELTAATEYDCEPLLAASEGGHAEIVRLLLDKSSTLAAKSDSRAIPFDYHSSFYHAFQIASLKGHLNVVRVMLESKVYILDRDDSGGSSCRENLLSSAVQVAIREGHKKVIQLLSEHSPNISPGRGDYYSALHAAAHQGDEDVMKQLLERQADVLSLRDSHGWTPWMIASVCGHTNIATLLSRMSDGSPGTAGSSSLPIEQKPTVLLDIFSPHRSVISKDGLTVTTSYV